MDVKLHSLDDIFNSPSAGHNLACEQVLKQGIGAEQS